MGNSLHRQVQHEGDATSPSCQLSASRGVKAGNEVAAVQPSAQDAAGCRDEAEIALCAARTELDASMKRSFNADYTTGQMIGHGAFSKVQVCNDRHTGQSYAVKAVQKSADIPQQREGIIKEVAITRMLAGHPCTVQLHAVYEDEQAFYLVMELCSGGELFDQIATRGHFSEQDAAGLMRNLLGFMAYAHSKHVVHRDLKPENILFTSSDRGAQLKVIDFGASDFCKPGQRLVRKFGTPYYVAPEVLGHDYAHAADVWSAGVILFIMLSGYPPFSGNSDSRILQRVLQGSYSFAAREWESVSEPAKSMITDMLVVEESRRSTAQQLLKHPWLAVGTSISPNLRPAAASALGAHIVRRLRGFARLSHLKRLALVIMARSLTDKDVSRLRSVFVSMDKDDDGRVSAQDLLRAVGQVGIPIDEEELSQLFTVANLWGQGVIDYEEFMAVMLDGQPVTQRGDTVRKSFESLDRDGDGYISVKDLAQVLQEDARQPPHTPQGCGNTWDLAAALVREVDLDMDGSVSFEEYRNMWMHSPEVVAA